MENQLPFYVDLYNPFTEDTEQLLKEAYRYASQYRHEFITPEHVLLALICDSRFMKVMLDMSAETQKLSYRLDQRLNAMETLTEELVHPPIASVQLTEMLEVADGNVLSCGKSAIEPIHIIRGLMSLKESWAQFLLMEAIKGEDALFLSRLIDDIMPVEDYFEEEVDKNIDDYLSGIHNGDEKKSDWKKNVVCINDIYRDQNPLIGREDELLKTIRVLVRKDKNNPLHIGEPGVGKTALVYGLAAMIENGKVPDKLKNAKIYRLDLGSLLAGTQYRGDFEKKLKTVMDGAGSEENAIIYIDEIHNLVGAGATGDGSMDASNLLKPYLESGKIRFIGATTYDEYKRHFAKSKSVVRRFTNIDIAEPSVEQTVDILRQLQAHYEAFHNVKYTDDAIEFAAKGSAKYINDRFLPDKAIDLIDESGAEKQMENDGSTEKIVDKESVSKILAKLCKVESLALTEDDPQNLEGLDSRIRSRLFGQDSAVSEVTESILMSKAGLSDEEKPLASLLFVGPTGVGKTELARLLAKELGVELIRFDMSEYTEKHAVAKLIGSPAGYVGYEDGGLLTDAIRKTPNAVLLLDEIEKAHSDIYNILLQVMDYARLTDNKGNKADFRNVVLIMTSNAGAQYAAQANVGFASSVTRGDAMLKQVKKTFKPEFINRLSAMVTFNDMSREMASMILDKKLGDLSAKLEQKNVRMTVSDDARELLLDKGFTREYGARELDRVIQHELKKILMKEILYGELKNGGEIMVNKDNDRLALCKKNIS